MKSDSHILILTPGFAIDEQDSNCIPPLQSLVLSFKETYPDADIRIISFQYPFIHHIYRWNDIPVYAAAGANKKYITRIFTWLRVFKYFLEIHKHKKVTTIHSFWLTECTFIGALIGKLFDIPVVATVPGQDARKTNKYLRLIKYFKVRIVCCSSFVANILKKSSSLTSEKIIPYGLHEKDLVFFHANRNRNIDVLGVGNLGNIKNYKVFVEIINELKIKYQGIRSMIIGDGEEYQELLEYIQQEGLGDHIFLTRGLKREEVLTLMNSSKILLHTSIYEGQGYVFLEALAYGMKVISFDVGYLPRSESSYVCNTKMEMIQKIDQLMSVELQHHSFVPLKMTDTIQQYAEMYK